MFLRGKFWGLSTNHCYLIRRKLGIRLRWINGLSPYSLNLQRCKRTRNQQKVFQRETARGIPPAHDITSASHTQSSSSRVVGGAYIHLWTGEYPHSVLMGHPPLGLDGSTPCRDWMGVLSTMGQDGVPTIQPPPLIETGWG